MKLLGSSYPLVPKNTIYTEIRGSGGKPKDKRVCIWIHNQLSRLWDKMVHQKNNRCLRFNEECCTESNNVTLSEDIHTIYMLIKVGRCSGCKTEINFVCVIRENKTRGTLQKDGEKIDRKWLGWIGGFLAFVCVLGICWQNI